ncbi:related to Tumor susceptibility gene 101 protein [Ustilago trichophora]|uniref:Related to Tumor susceptibility gene 101 protein n=1 Tax=Ustilago trichophora TaxID=86804 RepID=A0A5C3E0T2_9BASI|nr:related to Tumor susceptibility gene 101 protein [Ustilago trichophora]
MNHAVVQRWLRSVLGPYADRDRVFADVDRALIAVSSLSPKTEVFTFNDGRTQLLLTLDGTIPVEFRNTTYNIPVAYWIPQHYPREPPMAFVAPTPDMAIRKGPNVDPSGEIGGEYLARWRSKPEACNLLDLIHDCQQMFGREPPVYAKPKPTPVYATAATPQHRSQPSTPQQVSSSNAFAQRPGPPPLSASPRSPQIAAGPSFHSPSTHDPRQKPPPPATRPSGSQDPSQAPHRPPKPSSSLGPEGAIYAYSPRNSMSHTHLAGPAPTPAANGYRDSPQPPVAAPPKPKGINLLDEDDASTTSGLDSSSPHPTPLSHPAGTAAPPPPRPINPELLALHDRLFTKIDSRLSTLASTLQASNARLEVLSSDLDRGLPAIEDEMSRLKAVRDVCQTTGDRLASSVNEITESVLNLQAREDPDPDSMVLATSIVGNQLVDLVAEDNAIEDTLYHLGRALNAERIDLDRFLKQTRMLAREQFMKRALAMKISEGMGWAQ